jgi:hypothetical protein
MKSLFFFHLFIFGAVIIPIKSVYSADCTYNSSKPSSTSVTQDKKAITKFCNSDWVGKTWHNYGFVKKYWTNGYGWEDACNPKYLLSRTFAAIWALENAHTPKAKNTKDLSGPIVQWAPALTRDMFDDDGDLRAKCDGIAFQDPEGYFEVGLDFGYKYDLVSRAGILFHESVHKALDMDHDCEDRTKDSSWNLNGAWTYTIGYLVNYYFKANDYTNSTMRDFAADEAEWHIKGSFCDPKSVPSSFKNFR